jgi:tetratricopeptide (TPR) repeat protein
MRILTPTDAAGAREVVQRLITEGESFAILRDISPVSRGVGECFECTEIREQLDAAAQKAIQILNDATDGVCDMEDEEFKDGLSRIIEQPCYTSDNHSQNAQALTQLARHFESLAGAYKLRIKGSCEDPQATKFRLARALDAASVVLYSVASLHTRARNYADAIDCLTESAALSQVCAEIYHGLEKSIEEVDALKSAARALLIAAVSHSRLGNHAGAIDCNTKSAALYQRCAQIYGVLRDGENQADALLGASIALSNAARSHS